MVLITIGIDNNRHVTSFGNWKKTSKANNHVVEKYIHL